jgi:hypothetical protein
MGVASTMVVVAAGVDGAAAVDVGAELVVGSGAWLTC